jgi:outer membrane autotransporter protein
MAGVNVGSRGEITVKEVEIEGGLYGVCAENGILTITDGGTIKGSQTGIYSTIGGRINLATSTIEITQSTVGINVIGDKNIVASSATLNLTGNKTAIAISGNIEIGSATIAGNTVGISVSGDGRVSSGTINLSGNETAIKANENSNFTISDDIDKLSLTGNTVGLLASGYGSKIDIKSVRGLKTDGNETLIKAENNGTVKIVDGLTLEGNKTAINAVSGGSVTGEDITITGNTIGIEAEENGNIIFTGTVDIKGNTTGVNLAGGEIRADNIISITGNTIGVEVTSGTNNLKNATIANNETGIKLAEGNIILENTSITGNTIGIDLKNNTTLSATALTLNGNGTGIKVDEENNATMEVANLTLGESDIISITGGTLNINKTSITKQTGSYLFKTSGANNIINITGSKIGTTDSRIESLIETISGGASVNASNSQITSKIEDKEETNERQIVLNLTNNSNWQLTTDSRLKQLGINNSTVKIGTNTLRVNSLTNNGTGTIEMAIDISEPENDRMEIKEEIRGKYVIKATSAKTVGKEEVKEQIRIINSEAANPNTTFSINRGRVNISGYVYRLYQGSQLNIASVSKYNEEGLSYAGGSGIDKYSWYLVNSNDISEYIKGMVRASELMTFVAKSGMNTMNKRVGDIRRTPEDSYNGVWVRAFGKNYDVSEGIKSSMSLFGGEGGYDMRISKNSQDRYYIGAMVGYQSIGSINIKQEDEDRDSTGDGSAPSIGIYGSWIGQDGWYADIAARYIMVETNMKGYSNGQEIEYKPKANYVGFSGEVGKEIDINVSNGALIRLEPKIEISIAQRGTSKAEVSEGGQETDEIEFSGGNSINGKIGISAGYQIEMEDDKELTPFIELAYNNEFEGKTDVNYIGEQYNSDLSGGGIEASIGLNGYLGKGFNVYSLLSYESGSKQSNFGWNIGVRYGFGGKKELTRNNIKSKRIEIDEIEDTIETVKDTRNIQRVVVIRDQAAEKTQEGEITKIKIEDNGKYIKQSEITQGQVKYIRSLAEGLSTDRIDKIIIASHVGDNTGDERLNKRASIEKGKRVKQIMVKAGIEEEKIEIRGYGSKKQIADNGTKQGRNKNNRVEIFIKR